MKHLTITVSVIFIIMLLYTRNALSVNNNDIFKNAVYIELESKYSTSKISDSLLLDVKRLSYLNYWGNKFEIFETYFSTIVKNNGNGFTTETIIRPSRRYIGIVDSNKILYYIKGFNFDELDQFFIKIIKKVNSVDEAKEIVNFILYLNNINNPNSDVIIQENSNNCEIESSNYCFKILVKNRLTHSEETYQIEIPKSFEKDVIKLNELKH